MLLRANHADVVINKNMIKCEAFGSSFGDVFLHPCTTSTDNNKTKLSPVLYAIIRFSVQLTSIANMRKI